jgi:hypothetical protein
LFVVCCQTFLLIALALLAAGCSEGSGTVAGQVTYDGKPLPLGTISFHSQDDNHDVVNALVRDGAYSVSGVRTGTHKVTVVAINPDKAGGAAPAGGAGGATGGADGRSPVGRKPTPNFVPLPERYADPERSGLSVQVHAGEQKYDVPLSP